MRRLDGRIVLITGASRGLGAAAALACAREGAKLVLLARTRGALEELDDQVRALGAPDPTLVTLDLLQDDLVDRLGYGLYERFGRLDGFLGCAAELASLTPVAHLKPSTLLRMMSLNALANQRLIRTLDPLWRASPSARLVFVTDRTPREQAYWGGYTASKAALERIALAYAAETRKTRTRVNLAAPPPMRTRLRAQAFPGEREGVSVAPERAADRLLELLLPDCTMNGEVVSLA